MNPKSRQLHVVAERIGDKIDGVPQRGQRADTMVFGEGGAPGLEERLRRNHQDVHAGSGRPASRGQPHEAYMLHYAARVGRTGG
jgi:hypothetical protein